MTLASEVADLEADNRLMRRLLRAVMPTWMGCRPDLAWPDGYGDEDDPWSAWEEDVIAALGVDPMASQNARPEEVADGR